jgi:ABC-2 type transport system ATP-binding protein
MGQTAVLSVRDVTIRYGDRVAVGGLCLEVARGEVFGLLGPNGSGKSSTLSAVAGAVPAAAGVIRVAGLSECDDPLGYRRLFGLVPQELALFTELSGEDNLLLLGRLYGLAGRGLRRRVVDVLDFVRLGREARRPVRVLSGGMQRRLNLACALLHEPPLLLLDEPTVGLDVAARDAIFDNLRVLRDHGRALVFTTHHLEEAELLCDRVGIMDHGRLVAAGRIDELCGAPESWLCEPRAPRNASPEPTRLARVYRELTGRSLCAS